MKNALRQRRLHASFVCSNWQTVFSCVLVALLCATPSAQSDEVRYPMPERFATSVIVGKRLKNPFAAKLKLSQSKVANVVTDGSAKIEQTVKSKLSVGTTMFFGYQSRRNRAIINGRVRRPGDEVLAITEHNTELSVRLLEIREASVVLRVPEMPNQRPLVLLSEKATRRDARRS